MQYYYINITEKLPLNTTFCIKFNIINNFRIYDAAILYEFRSCKNHLNRVVFSQNVSLLLILYFYLFLANFSIKNQTKKEEKDLIKEKSSLHQSGMIIIPYLQLWKAISLLYVS